MSHPLFLFIEATSNPFSQEITSRYPSSVISISSPHLTSSNKKLSLAWWGEIREFKEFSEFKDFIHIYLTSLNSLTSLTSLTPPNLHIYLQKKNSHLLTISIG